MTDKVAKAGIEDVLSSIKRMVSEEDRSTPGPLASAIKRKPSRLVLTDALRVGDAPQDSQSATQEPAYKAEDSVKPMLLRACDIVKHAEPAVEQNTESEPEDGPVDSLSAKIEALEAAIAKTEDQWEPDGDSDDAYSGTTTRALHWHIEDEFIVADSTTAKVAEPEQPELTKATFIRDTEIAERTPTQPQPVALSLDEDSLRDLIAQVVREELQGVLGERITRNVRKMVRREIYRALAEQKTD